MWRLKICLLNTIVEDLRKLTITITGPQAEAIMWSLSHAVSSVDYEDDVSLPAHGIGDI
jgi:hypothetical protein